MVIAFIGFVLALFPHLNRTKALQATAVYVMPARDENAEYAAVIAAAIYATLGVRHIAHIGEARPSSAIFVPRKAHCALVRTCRLTGTSIVMHFPASVLGVRLSTH